jgi:hypothetical protein
MKLFVYKSLFIGSLFFIVFHLTFGYSIKYYESKFQNFFTKEKTKYFKEKIRLEIKEGLQKDRILNKEDSILIEKFITKISKELNDTK